MKIKTLFSSTLLIDILLTLKDDNDYTLKLNKKLNTSHAYLCKLLKILKDLKLITFKKKGRIKYIHLTEKGKIIQKYILKIEIFLK